MSTRFLALALCFGLPASYVCASPTPLQDPIEVYVGNLHAHSQLSDGNPDITPAEAYQIARDQG